MTASKNPYLDLPRHAFWRTAVADKNAFDIEDLWVPNFPISPSDRITTYGSCFAQHFGKALRANGFTWNIAETAPVGSSEATKARFGYDVFSARTGNIYTTSLLNQWVGWASGDPVPDEIWKRDGRFFDPFRPAIEPNGFESHKELLLSRAETISSFKRSIIEADIFVFTLGLTEKWVNTSGYEYPMCPGTVAGDYSPDRHKFKNMSFSEVQSDLASALDRIKCINPNIKFLLTVSPVPLTATNSGRHVLVATTGSKSILRAVAEEASQQSPKVDYFPSYEIISSTPFKSMFYEPNLRSVNLNGVSHVMKQFFDCLSKKYPFQVHQPKTKNRTSKVDDVACEEELLEAFGGTK